MADLVLRESQGWFEVEPSEIASVETLEGTPDDDDLVFNDGLHTDAIVDRLEDLELISEPASEAYDRHDPHDMHEAWGEIFDDVRVVQEFAGLKGWRLRIWVHVRDEALDAD